MTSIAGENEKYGKRRQIEREEYVRKARKGEQKTHKSRERKIQRERTRKRKNKIAKGGAHIMNQYRKQ